MIHASLTTDSSASLSPGLTGRSSRLETTVCVALSVKEKKKSRSRIMGNERKGMDQHLILFVIMMIAGRHAMTATINTRRTERVADEEGEHLQTMGPWKTRLVTCRPMTASQACVVSCSFHDSSSLVTDVVSGKQVIPRANHRMS